MFKISLWFEGLFLPLNAKKGNLATSMMANIACLVWAASWGPRPHCLQDSVAKARLSGFAHAPILLRFL